MGKPSNLFAFWLLLALCSSFLESTEIKRNSTSSSINSPRSGLHFFSNKNRHFVGKNLKCGSVISCAIGYGTAVNNIVYRPSNGGLEKGERCPFILAIPGATSYTISAFSLGYSTKSLASNSRTDEPDVGLLLMGFSFDNEEKIVKTETLKDVLLNVTIPGNVLIITFYTEEPFLSRQTEPFNGYILHFDYSVHSTGTLFPISRHSTQALITTEETIFHHPNRSNEYNAVWEDEELPNRELSTFVFVPDQNVAQYRMHISYHRKLQAEQLDCDIQQVQVFAFQYKKAEQAAVWKFQGLLCDNTNFLNMTINDLAMFVLWSKRNVYDEQRDFILRYEK